MTAANNNYAKVSHELVILDRHKRMLGYTTKVIDCDDDGRLSVPLPGLGRVPVTLNERGEHTITITL